jgi:CBS-domain-containing membrane protein
MRSTNRRFRAMTAGDVMSRKMVTIPQQMSVGGAARLLARGADRCRSSN